MIYRIEVAEKKGFYDAVGASVKKDIQDLGFGKRVKEVKAVLVYLLEGSIGNHETRTVTYQGVSSCCLAWILTPASRRVEISSKSGGAMTLKLVPPWIMPVISSSLNEATAAT